MPFPLRKDEVHQTGVSSCPARRGAVSLIPLEPLATLRQSPSAKEQIRDHSWTAQHSGGRSCKSSGATLVLGDRGSQLRQACYGAKGHWPEHSEKSRHRDAQGPIKTSALPK